MKSFIEFLNEEIGISDNSVYLSNMAKSFKDKAWFIQFLPEDAETFVDFGGGAGEFCEYVAGMTKIKNFVVIDNNKTFLGQAVRKGFDGFETLDDLAESGKYDLSNAVLNMSSVIHEIYAYSDPFYDDPGVFWTTVGKCGFKTLTIRDMSMAPSNYRNPPVDALCWFYKNVLLSPKTCPHGTPMPDLVESFESEWGSICDPALGRVNLKNLLHFLVKYRYVENWDREVRENYFPVSQDRLQQILKRIGYSITHKESSKLGFYGRTWDKDFKLNRPSPNEYGRTVSEWLKTLSTHIKWLAERR